METPLIIVSVITPFIVIISLITSYKSQKKRRLLTDLPTSTTQGAFIGLVELKGSAESESPLLTFLSEVPAVHYTWSVTEHWERWETQTYQDSNGKTKTRQVRKSGWSTVASGNDSQPFYLADETGHLLVRPDGADVRGVSVFNQYCGRRNPLYYEKGPSRSIANSTGRRHFSERAIVLHEQLYIVGKARERSDMVAAEIALHKAAPIFLITTESEKQVLRRLATSAILWFIAGVIAAAGFGAVLGQAIGVTIGIAAYFTTATSSRLILLYNSMIDTRNRMRQGASQIDVQLKHRADLIPPLVSIVEAIAGHEKNLQTILAELRNESAATAPGSIGNDPHALVPHLRTLAENYPILKSDSHFIKLQEQLTETEQRLALARSYFNDIATNWNNRVEQFPDSVLAKFFSFHRQPLFEALDFERAEVGIDFVD